MKKSKKPLTPNTNECDLLIVEDEENYRILIGMVIQKRFPDLRIHYAGDGLEGLEKAEALKPPTGWTCVRMPRMDGLEMIERIRQNQGLQNTKIILCTASYSMERVKTRALELGVDRLLPKPFEFEEALSLIAEWLSRQ